MPGNQYLSHSIATRQNVPAVDVTVKVARHDVKLPAFKDLKTPATYGMGVRALAVQKRPPHDTECSDEMLGKDG